MSIATQLSRIKTNRNTIRAKLVELGMATSTDKLDALAAAIENIVNQGAVSVTVQEGDTYTIPKGYHNGSGTVSGVKGGGNYNLQSKTATPTKKQQSITPDSGYYGLSDVTVSPIPDSYQDVSSVTAGAGDVLTGKVYVLADGTVTIGTMPNNGAVSKTLDATTITYTIPKGHHNGSGKVTIVLETKTVTPTKSTQKITPASGKVISEVTVNPIPEEYITTEDADAVAADILKDKTAYVGGVKVTGSMPNNGTVSKKLDRNTPSYTIPKGCHSGEGKVEVRAVEMDTTPTKEAKVVESDDGEFITRVTIDPIPDQYQDVTPMTATYLDVLEGKKIIDSSGYAREGAIKNNGDTSVTIDGLNDTSVTIPKGYTSGGTVSLTSDIEDALAVI